MEQQAREYVLEMKVRLLRHLSLGSKVASTLVTEGPPQAQQFISLLLEEYSALCQAACTISAFLVTLVRLTTQPVCSCLPGLMLTVVSGLFQVSSVVVNCKVLFVFVLRGREILKMQLSVQKCGLGISYSGLMKFFVREERGGMLFVALILKQIFKQIYEILDILMWKTLLC